MFMRMNDSDWNQITSTKEPIEITVDVPEDIQGAIIFILTVYFHLKKNKEE